MRKYYWLLAGVLVGVASVGMAYTNYNMVLPDGLDGAISWAGAAVVVLEYTVVVYALSLGQRALTK